MFLPSYGAAGSSGVDTAFDAAYIALWQLARHSATTLLGVALAGKRMRHQVAAKKEMNDHVGYRQSC
jgi:hypothetical protein